MLDSERPSAATGLVLEGQSLTIADVDAVARRGASVHVADDERLRQKIQSSVDLVRKAVEEGRQVYGVTTGFGSMAEVEVAGEFAAASQANLLSFLATGAGPAIAPRHVRAAMLLRANMLLRGASGVRLEVIQRLVRMLQADATPVVRELGSIGASGDLVPLAAVARAVTGVGGPARVMLRGRLVEAQEALAELNLRPLPPLPKEALALVNGTSFSSAIAANCVSESRTLLAVALASHALMIRALAGRDEPFEAFVHQCKPHPGQIWTAQLMRQLLQPSEGGDGAPEDQHASRHPGNGVPADDDSAQLQDRYSLRCLPQYFAPIVETLARLGRVVETEMNAVTDNPLVDPDQQRFYQSGNFLGQYVGVAMDELRGCLSMLAKHLDVQIAQLVSPEFSNGLPASLQGNSQVSYNMGLKGLQITGNSIMPLLAQLASPLVPHFPTHAEQHNQNINGLSWGAANLAWRAVGLFQQYAAVAVIFAVQAADLRAHRALGHYDGRALLSPLAASVYEAVWAAVGRKPGAAKPLVFDDAEQSLESYIERLADDLQEHGDLPAAVTPIVESFDGAEL